METKNMSANPHSIVHARQYNDVEKTKQDEQAPRKAEPGVKGVVRQQRKSLFRGSSLLFLFALFMELMFKLRWLSRIIHTMIVDMTDLITSKS
jgi:hypothetical protein